jgi:hypothetical protein
MGGCGEVRAEMRIPAERHLAWGAPPALLHWRRGGGCDWPLTRPLDGKCRISPEAAAGQGCSLTFTAARPARSDEGTGIYAVQTGRHIAVSSEASDEI